MKKLTKAYYFTYQEFITLLSFEGLDNIVIFEDIKNTIIDKKEVVQAMASLLQNGIFENDHGAYAISIEVKNILTCMKESKHTFVEYTHKNSCPARCIYGKDHYVVIQVDNCKEDQIRVEYQDRETFFSELLENNILEELQETDEKDMEEEEVQELFTCLKKKFHDIFSYSLNKLVEKEEILLLLDEYDNQELCKNQRSLILRHGIYDYVLKVDKESHHVHRYSKNEMSKLYG